MENEWECPENSKSIRNHFGILDFPSLGCFWTEVVLDPYSQCVAPQLGHCTSRLYPHMSNTVPKHVQNITNTCSKHDQHMTTTLPKHNQHMFICRHYIVEASELPPGGSTYSKMHPLSICCYYKSLLRHPSPLRGVRIIQNVSFVDLLSL